MTEDSVIRCTEIESRLNGRINDVQDQMLTERDIDAVATRAVDLAFERMYKNVGESVLRKALWVVGVGVFSLFVWLSSRGVEWK